MVMGRRSCNVEIVVLSCVILFAAPEFGN